MANTKGKKAEATETGKSLIEKQDEIKALAPEALLALALSQSEEIADQQELIDDLYAEVERLTVNNNNPGFKIVSVDGKNYQFTAPKFERKGKVYITSEIADSDPIVAELIGIGSGLIVSLKTEEEE